MSRKVPTADVTFHVKLIASMIFASDADPRTCSVVPIEIEDFYSNIGFYQWIDHKFYVSVQFTEIRYYLGQYEIKRKDWGALSKKSNGVPLLQCVNDVTYLSSSGGTKISFAGTAGANWNGKQAGRFVSFSLGVSQTSEMEKGNGSAYSYGINTKYTYIGRIWTIEDNINRASIEQKFIVYLHF